MFYFNFFLPSLQKEIRSMKFETPVKQKKGLRAKVQGQRSKGKGLRAEDSEQ
jgi:hypothetical protein